MRVPSNAGLDERVLRALQTAGRMTAAEIGRTLGLDRAPVSGALNRLRTRGLARVAGYAHHQRTWGDAGVPAIWEAVSAK